VAENGNLHEGDEENRPIFRAAARSKEFFDHLEAHYRECKRKEVDVDADVRLVLEDGSLYSQGTAKVKDVSPSGALLADLELDREGYPVGGFTIEMRMRSSNYEGIGFRCKPVRFVPEENGVGVQFQEVYVEEK
jgi:hypothetical protein